MKRKSCKHCIKDGCAECDYSYSDGYCDVICDCPCTRDIKKIMGEVKA